MHTFHHCPTPSLKNGCRKIKHLALPCSSYFDSVKSEEEAGKLPYNPDLGSIDGLDPLSLEMTELPRSSKVGLPLN